MKTQRANIAAICTSIAMVTMVIFCIEVMQRPSDPEATPFVITFESMEPPASPGMAVCEECQYRPDTADPLVPVSP